jgi:hypothetical protein
LTIHAGQILLRLILFEAGAFAITAVILLAKWTRYYGNFSSAWAVVFGSEVRLLEFVPLWIGLSIAGFIFWAAWAAVHFFAVKISW